MIEKMVYSLAFPFSPSLLLSLSLSLSLPPIIFSALNPSLYLDLWRTNHSTSIRVNWLLWTNISHFFVSHIFLSYIFRHTDSLARATSSPSSLYGWQITAKALQLIDGLPRRNSNLIQECIGDGQQRKCFIGGRCLYILYYYAIHYRH